MFQAFPLKSFLFLICFAAAITTTVAQLKPVPTSPEVTLAQSNRLPTSPLFQNRQSNITTDQTEFPTDSFDHKSSELGDSQRYAKLLNELLFDYFTTQFGIETQSKWATELSVGSPFLSDLASYLKLDKLYDIDLYSGANAQLNRLAFDALALEHNHSRTNSLFDFLAIHSKDYWPMSLFTSIDSIKHSPQLLLNHYDRDFVIDIEKQDMAKKLAPLAHGIERLLMFHLQDSLRRNISIRAYRSAIDIDTVVVAFKPYLNSNDLFQFYNLIAQRNWQGAAVFLQSSRYLNQDRYLFLYDLMAINSPQAMINNVQYESYYERTPWWQEFFHQQICVLSHLEWTTIINDRLSIQFNCAANQIESTPPILDEAADAGLISEFWNKILNQSELTPVWLDKYFNGQTFNKLEAMKKINSHDVLNYLASQQRLKIVRSASVFQRVDKNFNIWKNYARKNNNDSFIQYQAIHLWFQNNPIALKQVINNRLVELMPNLSDSIKTNMATRVLHHIETNTITDYNWQFYSDIAALMPPASQIQLALFADMNPGFRVEKPKSINNLSATQFNQLNESSIEMTFLHKKSQMLDNGWTYENYLLDVQSLIYDFTNRYGDSELVEELRDYLNDDGTLSERMKKHLSKEWYRRHPAP